MMHTRNLWVVVMAVIGILALDSVPQVAPENWAVAYAQTEPPPTFELDPSWPKPLPNNLSISGISAVAVDQRDHVWVIHGSINRRAQLEKEGKVPAAPVAEFDAAGNFVRAFGGPEHGLDRVHGINIDHKGNVWTSSFRHVVVKFSPEGKVLLQIGQLDKTNGSNDTQLLGSPANVDFDPAANEVYIADGYINRRVIVYDADTGQYKRHWGRYGAKPDDTFEPGKQPPWDTRYKSGSEGGVGFFPRFGHGANLSRDGIVYVADRAHSTLQLFWRDGTFIREVPTPLPVNAVAFSPDPAQHYVYAGGINASTTMVILRRSDLQVLGMFKSDSQHYLDTDSKGNLFTCGRGLPQKFVLKSMPKR